jgi:MAP/microtubule affinity-regulating kinase
MKGIVFSGTPSHKIPLSPSAPFGPKAKAFIIPNKDLSDQSRVVEMDQLENYNIWSEIGKGSYAVVKLSTHRETMQKCAIKVYSNKSLEDSALKENVLREIKILQMIDHKNIVKFYEQIIGERNLYLVMEYVKGIGLNNHLIAKSLKRLQEFEACHIFTQVISALQYCHERNITHRDIKLENIQLDLHSNVKLIDFGFATCIPSNKKSLIYCGSPSYMAPEIINKVEYFGPPVDIWACGVVLVLLVTGDFPFKGNTEKRVFNKIKKGKFEIPASVSPLCADLIRKILVQNPELRLNARQVLDHAWIKTCGGTAVYATPSFGDNIEVTDE